MKKLKMHTPDLTQDNIARIRDLFPNCVTEATNEHNQISLVIDFDQLRQELSGAIVEGAQERYQLNWPGKREALLTANAPIAKTLRPCRQESVNFDTTQNLFIEGDNLDALKLLQETYLGKVKMIYIDPPYNTGNDFIYEDDFAETTETFLKRSNQKDEAGNHLIANKESNGRFHSDWLSMIYPRLKLARNLLRDDGVIFISIDDNEQANLKRLCDEVFGEENFLANVVWEKKYTVANDAKYFSDNHDHIIVFAKNVQFFKIGRLPRSEEMDNAYKNPDNHPKGAWKSTPLHAKSGSEKMEKFEFTFLNGVIWSPPTGTYPRFSEETLRRLDEGNEIWFGKDGRSTPAKKTFLIELKNDGVVPRTILSHKDAGHNHESKEEIKNLFGENTFDTPKPTKLLKLLQIVGNIKEEDIILDFFSGSATTAHAVMQLNAEDGGKRKFIMVQLPEQCDEKSEAFKAGYKTIAEIGKERIRRAGQKIKSDNPLTTQDLDIGFRVFKTDTSNMADVFYSPDAVDKNDLLSLVDNIKPDRTAEDLLFQLMLDWGVELALPIAKKTIHGKEVFLVDGNALVACFDAHGGVDEEFVKELAKIQPLRVVFRDAGFKDSAVKINVEQIFKLLSPETDVKCI